MKKTHSINTMASEKNVCVVVLGDIGRSPRMQYHSESFAEQGYKVDIVCYKETNPRESLAKQPLVSFHYLNSYPNMKLPRFINYVFKTIWQAISLFFLLLIIRKPNYVLVQNPPAIPALFVCWIFSTLVRAKYVIDWHNYAYTIMALNVGTNHILVRLTKKIEMFVGRRSAHNFCVTKEMKDDLNKNYGIRATTLYDRPSNGFQVITTEEQHELLRRLSRQYDSLKGNEHSDTVLTKSENEGCILKDKRPGVLISSTSWTDDEDFSILLKALEAYEEHINTGNHRHLPDLLCIITGKGPLKDYYLEKMDKLNFNHVKILTPWLEAADYPKMVATADLGICLHTSSSGLDLPMKVVDMFGCQVPVCAYNFRSLYELVKHGENSFVFNNAKELSAQLQLWFENFPNDGKQKILNEKFRKELERFRCLGWSENWNTVALNAFQK